MKPRSRLPPGPALRGSFPRHRAPSSPSFALHSIALVSLVSLVSPLLLSLFLSNFGGIAVAHAAPVGSGSPTNAVSNHGQVLGGGILGACLAFVVVLVVAIALCVGKKQPQELPPELQRAEASHSAVDMQFSSLRDEADLQASNDGLDEDALANASMHHTHSHGHGHGQRHDSVSVSALNLKRARNIIHRSTKRLDAEQMIRAQVTETGESGVFLVRAKREDQGVYALDIGWFDTGSKSVYTTHHLLSRAPTGIYLFDEEQYSPNLKSLEDLLQYLSKPKNKALNGCLTAMIPSEDTEGPVDNSAA